MSCTVEDLQKAIEAVSSGVYSIPGASRSFNVPETTLRKWVGGLTSSKPKVCLTFSPGKCISLFRI